MNNFIEIFDAKNGFRNITDDDTVSLSELFSLRSDPEFGTEEFSEKHPGLRSLNDNYRVINVVKDAMETDEKNKMAHYMYWSSLNRFFHRTLCAVKAIHLWEKYKRVYEIDKDWYQDFLRTEDIPIDFSMMTRLPFDSFYIDLSNAGVMRTNHYNNVIGIIVNIIDDNTLHLTVIDADNEMYNPESLPPEWSAFDTGSVHFLDFVLERNKAASMLSKDNPVGKTFGWTLASGDCAEALDVHSPVLRDLIRFTVQFLYFLHSKTNDIVQRETPVYTRKPSSSSSNPVNVWKVGFRYGEKLRKLNRKRALYGDGIVGGDRSRPRAYVRCAHWHKHWCGSGDERRLEPRWHEPTYCNGTVSDIVATINEVTENYSSSSGEEMIEKYLTKMGVNFEREYTVNIKGHNRRYDFRVEFKNKVIFIEFDGEQHFTPVEKFGGGQGLRERQRADWDKNKYARKANIPLLRIRYDQAGLIPEIIDSFLEKPKTRVVNPMMSNSEYYGG